MPISLSEAKAQLLKGASLSWNKFENHKAGSITLETAGARRLFKFLAEQVSSKVAEANEQLFPGLIASWAATDDPAEALATTTAVAAGGVWRLARIGVAQAEDIKKFWDKQLRPKLHQAFHVCAQFEAFIGEPRLFAWQDNVIAFPDGHKDAIKKLTLMKTGIAAAAKTDGRAGDGVVTLKEWESAQSIKLFNHDVYQLAAGTLDPVAAIGDFLIVSNFAPVTKHSIVVATFGDQLLARRYSETDVHPDMAILTGQTLEPHDLPQPVIAPKEKIRQKKVVGTLFVSHLAPLAPKIANQEVVAIADFSIVEKALANARLFEVQGRSAEPIALETQLLVTHAVTFGPSTLKHLEGRLVVAVDDSGARYFKRLRVHNTLVVLESLNPDGTTPAQLLSLDGSHSLPKLVNLLEVVGVIFEVPEQASKG